MTARASVRVLIGPAGLPGTLDDAGLTQAYAWSGSSVRANMIATLDGAVSGPDGLSGSLGNATDRAVFDALRAASDAIVVGAATARAENYGLPPPGRLLVVISRSGRLPDRLLVPSDAVVLAMPECAVEPAGAVRSMLGSDRVWILGAEEVAPVEVLSRLRALGRRRVLLEGGPRLLAQWVAAGCVDELCLTTVPRLLGGGAGLLPSSIGDFHADLLLLLESGGTLLGRWAICRA